MFKKTIIIAGVPRSGTSWLGQIIDSHPSVAFRYQPIFSYAFKDAIGLKSSKLDFETFLAGIYNSNDDFLNRTQQKKEGIYPIFEKKKKLDILAFKNVRYHYLLEKFIDFFPKIKILGIIRNPCAVINSFLTNPREFPQDKDPLKEWRYAKCRNKKPEEYFGFEKWKEATNLFLKLAEIYPNNFKNVMYEELVSKPINITENIFQFLNLKISSQTYDFIKKSQQKHLENPSAVFKSKIVKYKWIWQLNPTIAEEIITNLINTPLEKYIRL